MASPLLKIISYFYFFLISCHALQISKRTPIDIRVKQGEPYDLNCVVDQKWDFCTWTNIHSGQKCLIRANGPDEVCAEDQPRFFKFHIEDNTCTLRISDAQIPDFSEWKCLIHSGTSFVEATINVTVYSPTKLDFKTKPTYRLIEGKETHIDCSGTGGFPQPNLLAAVGPTDRSDTIRTDDTALERIQQDSRYDENTQEIIMYSLFNYTPSIEHENYYVKCIAIQSGFQDGQVMDIYPMQVVSQQYEVIYAPKVLNKELNFGFEPGNPGIVTFTLKSNPKPTNEQIVWHFVRKSHEETFQLTAGTQLGRFDARVPDIDKENNVFNVTLIVNDWTEEDLNCDPYLEVINDVNVLNQHFSLSVQKPDYHPDDDPEATGEGMSRSAIIALIIISIIVVIACTGIGVWYCYTNKYACFQPSGELQINVELQDMHTTNSNVVLLLNEAEKEPMNNQDTEISYQTSVDEVDSDISQVQLKKATQKHQSFNGKPETTAAEKRSPNQRESYKVATNRESVSTPKWPEDSSVKITKE